MKSGTLEETRTLHRTGTIRMLILEETPEDLELILRKIKESGLHVDHMLVETREGFLRALQNSEFDAVLADYRLPGWTGMEALEELRALGRDIPFLLVSGTLGEEAAVECIKQGASDYIPKDRINRLPAALRRALQEKSLREEARQAHQALIASEASARRQVAELDLIYRTAPIGLAVFDRNLHYLRVNETLARVHQLSGPEHAGRSIYEVIPGVAEAVAAHLRRVLETGESALNVEVHAASDSDDRVWKDVIANFYPLRAEDGSIFAVCALVVYISERKKSEEALRLSEARCRTLIEHAPEAVVVHDLDTDTFIEVNRNAEILYGYSREELLHLNAVQLSPPFQPDGRASTEAARRFIDAAMDGETPTFEWVHRNAAGEEIPCEVRLVRMPSPRGRLIRGSIADIRERKRAVEELRLSEMRSADLVEHSIYGIAHVATDGAFLDGNPALLSILRCTSLAELQALNLLLDIFRFPEECGQLLAKCREQAQVQAEAEWRRRDGGIVAVRLHLRRVCLANHPETIEVVAEDVTELKAMERQLQQAQKFEAIGQLAGGVAHDLNNVVGAILGWAELGYEQNRGNPEAAARFTRIREQAARAATLTQELVAFARQQVLQPQVVDLNSITGNVMSLLEKVIPKDIELKIITVTLDAVKAVPAQIEQVLMNLCLNARDAMPTGGRLLIETEMMELDEAYCRFHPGVAPGRYAVLSVSDTGIGMDAQTKEGVFEPFFTTKERGRGTGIGLATAYGIVKQHGGFIQVYSEVGQGSLFRTYLPVLPSRLEEGDSAKAAAPPVGEMHGTETILLAEDHESIREMVRQTLLGLGYRVFAASDGVEALRLCENEIPALAILDVIMPRLGGIATAERLSKLFDGLPVLFTSGYSREAKNRTPQGDKTRYLQKPYSPTTLGRMVREMLDERKRDGKSR
jgi:PAS domain S-box-containing protein